MKLSPKQQSLNVNFTGHTVNFELSSIEFPPNNNNNNNDWNIKWKNVSIYCVVCRYRIYFCSVLHCMRIMCAVQALLLSLRFIFVSFSVSYLPYTRYCACEYCVVCWCIYFFRFVCTLSVFFVCLFTFCSAN